MSSHPDADAFMRGYLRQPTDVTTRLVFADWLEETGTPWNRAWAYYIRVSAEADAHPPGSHERQHYQRQAAEYAPKIRARLTIPAGLFVSYPKSLLQLLPGSNVIVRLDGFSPAPDALELVPECIAWENTVFPLAAQGRTLLFAAETPWDARLPGALEYVHNRRAVLVGAATDDIQDALRRHYSDGCISTALPLVMRMDLMDYLATANLSPG